MTGIDETGVRQVVWLLSRAVARDARRSSPRELEVTDYAADAFAIRQHGRWYRVQVTDAGESADCRSCGGGPHAGHQSWCGAPGKRPAPAGRPFP